MFVGIPILRKAIDLLKVNKKVTPTPMGKDNEFIDRGILISRKGMSLAFWLLSRKAGLIRDLSKHLTMGFIYS